MILTDYKSRLPHIQPIGATFFVTFSLADALLFVHIKKLKSEFENNITEIKFSNKSEIEKSYLIYNEQKRYFKRYDELLDKALSGSKHLINPDIAQFVSEKLKEFDQKAYKLMAFCIMPNHVHALMDFSIQDTTGLNPQTTNYIQLHDVMKSIKGCTARYGNVILNKTGTPFWRKDGYDHCVRNLQELTNIFYYILDNPVKANLVKEREDWQWTYVSPNLL